MMATETVVVRACRDDEHRAIRTDLAKFRRATALVSIAISKGETLEYRSCIRCSTVMAMAIDNPPLVALGKDDCPACGGQMSLRGLPCMDCVATGRRHVQGSCDECGDLLLVPASVDPAGSCPLVCVACAERSRAV